MSHMSHLHDDACRGPFAGTHGRRAFLGGGLGGLLSATIPAWQARADLAAADRPQTRRPKSCILLWMNGGPSHLDTFDPKPDTDVAGPVKAVKTSLPDVRFSEYLPQLAERARHLAVVRSMTTKEGNHDRGQYLMHTGYAPSATLKHPSLGAWAGHESGDRNADLPNFVSIRGPSVGAGFLGVEFNPFIVQQPSEGVRNLPLPRDVDAARFAARREALAIAQRHFRRSAEAAVAAHDAVYAEAERMMNSPRVKAFDVAAEPTAVQRRYGENDFGRGCLMARRLIEAGVRFVEVTLDGWDTHYDNFTAVKNLCRVLDPAYSSLVDDLRERDRLDDVLVVWMGEFGRTPKITSVEGRDHWPAAWSAVLAGGGVRGGQVYGATDAEGAKVVADPVGTADYFATLATLLGMDPTREAMSPVGRPIAISDNGRPITRLIG